MNKSIFLILGLLIWLGVMWDGFATIVLPRTFAPMKRLSGRFYKLSFQFWTLIARRIRSDDHRLGFLAIYGPLSVMFMLVIWADSGDRRVCIDLSGLGFAVPGRRFAGQLWLTSRT